MTNADALETLPALDRSSESPMWFQVLRSIESGISTGVWSHGSKLPSEHELREHYRVSRTTIREALARLEKSGIISRQQGRGAFVDTTQAPSSWTLESAPSLLGQLADGDRSALTSTVLRSGVDVLPPWAAAVFKGDGHGFVLERTRAVGTLTAVHVVNYMPKRFAAVLPSLREPRASLYVAAEQVLGTRITRMHRTIEAHSADRALARLLEIEEGHPIVVVEAVAYDQNDEPIDFSRASVRTDRMRVTVDSGHNAAGLDARSTSGTYPGR